METPEKGYQPSAEEQAKAEEMMTRIQQIQSKMRDETYGQLDEKGKAAFREMVNKGDAVVRALKEKGLLDRSPDQILQEYRENMDRIRRGEEPFTPAIDAIVDLPEFKKGNA